MSSYIITFTASVKFEASTRIGFQIARDAIEEAVAEALPGLDTYDSGPIVLLSAENPYGFASGLQARL